MSRDRAAKPFGAVTLALLAAVTLYSYLRGQRPDPEWAGVAYYVVDYGDGLIRRGLVGQVFLLVFDRSQAPRIFAAAVTVHRLFAMLLMGGVLLWFWQVVTAAPRDASRRLLLIYLLFVAGQFLPTEAAINTYLDVYVLVLVLAAGACASSGWFWPAAGLGFGAPFVHDMAVFLWPPLVIAMGVRERWFSDRFRSLRQPARIAFGAAPLLGYLALRLLESHHALETQLARAPIPDAVRAVMKREQFGHSLSADAWSMVGNFHAHFWRAVISIAAFALPSALMAIVAAPLFGKRACLWLAASAVSPLLMLGLAYDLSRFTVLSSFSVLLAILVAAGGQGMLRNPPPMRAPWAVAAAAVLMLVLPFCYGYFDRTMFVTNEVLDNAAWLGPHLRAAYGFVQREIGGAGDGS